MEATVKRDQTNQLCAKGDLIISYKALPRVLNVKRAIHAEEAIELFVLLVHLVTLDKKIVLNVLLDLSAKRQVPNSRHQFARMDRIVWKALQLVLHVQQVSFVLRASIIIVLLEHTTPILGKAHVKRALQDISAQKGLKHTQYVLLEIIVIQALQYVPHVKRLSIALVDLGIHVRLTNTVRLVRAHAHCVSLDLVVY